MQGPQTKCWPGLRWPGTWCSLHDSLDADPTVPESQCPRWSRGRAFQARDQRTLRHGGAGSHQSERPAICESRAEGGALPKTEKLSPLMRRRRAGPAWPALGSWKVLLQDGPCSGWWWMPTARERELHSCMRGMEGVPMVRPSTEAAPQRGTPLPPSLGASGASLLTSKGDPQWPLEWTSNQALSPGGLTQDRTVGLQSYILSQGVIFLQTQTNPASRDQGLGLFLAAFGVLPFGFCPSRGPALQGRLQSRGSMEASEQGPPVLCRRSAKRKQRGWAGVGEGSFKVGCSLSAPGEGGGG